MGISVIPAPSAGSKTLKRTTLTSGTSYTVPAGVTEINVVLFGAGGGGGGAGGSGSDGSAGGSTTMTGATTATGGRAGRDRNRSSDSITNNAPNSNTGKGGSGQERTESQTGFMRAFDGQDGDITVSTLSVTPTQSIAYSIGAGGSGGSSNNGSGTAGASGKIEVEYWS